MVSASGWMAQQAGSRSSDKRIPRPKGYNESTSYQPFLKIFPRHVSRKENRMSAGQKTQNDEQEQERIQRQQEQKNLEQEQAQGRKPQQDQQEKLNQQQEQERKQRQQDQQQLEQQMEKNRIQRQKEQQELEEQQKRNQKKG
jgi:hypothetical protein